MTAQAATAPVRGQVPGLRAERVPGGAPGGLAWLVALASLAFFATAQYCRQLYSDTYYDLYAGRYLTQHGIPHRNVFTVIAHGRPWIDQQWLAQLFYYRAWQLGGYAAMVILSLGLVSLGFVLFGALMLRRGVSPLRMCAWTSAAMAVSYGYATPRAQSFGYLFVPLVLWMVLGDDGRMRPRPVTWLSLPLLVVWANVHGSVLVGAGIVGLHAARRAWAAMRARRTSGTISYVLLGAGATVTVICTPYGLGVLGYYTSLIGNPVLIQNGGEWAPPDPAMPYSWAFYAVLVAIAGAVIVGWRRGARPHPELAVITLATLATAQLAFRNVPWFGYAGCLLAAEMLGARSAPLTLAASFRRMLAGALAAFAVVTAIGLVRAPASDYEAWVPRRSIDVAAKFAARDPALRVISDQWSAAAMLWLHPAMLGRVAFDGRDEQYTQAEIAEIFAFAAAGTPHWQRALQGYNLVVVSRQWQPALADAMTRMSGWRLVYTDAAGVVLERVY